MAAIGSQSVPAAASARGVPFFALLLFATSLPFLVFPLAAGPLAGVELAGSSREALMFLGSSAHVASSFFFYGDSRMRAMMLSDRARFFVAPAIVIAATAAWFAFAGEWVAYGVCAYWIWQTHHYTRQNHGILAFVSRATSCEVSLHERTAVTLSGVAGVIGMLTFVAPYHSTFLMDAGWQLHMIALGVYAAAWGFYLLSLFTGRAGSGGGPLRRVMLLVLLVFYAPLFLSDDQVVAVGCYAMAHGLQYLVFMSYVAKQPSSSLVPRVAALVGFIALGGWFLNTWQQGQWSLGGHREAIFGAYLGVVMWHFLLDAGVWRLSEPAKRSYMAERFQFLAPPRT